MAKLIVERPHYGDEGTVALVMDAYEARVLADLIRQPNSGLAYTPPWVQDLLMITR